MYEIVHNPVNLRLGGNKRGVLDSLGLGLVVRRLPSPTWPKPQSGYPETPASVPHRRAQQTSPIREIGTRYRTDADSFAFFCASPMFSRSAHKRLLCSTLCATTASLIVPFSSARSKKSSNAARSPTSSPAPASSTSKCQGLSEIGACAPGICFTTSASAKYRKPVRKPSTSPRTPLADRRAIARPRAGNQSQAKPSPSPAVAEKLHDRSRDDPGAAFGANKQLLEVVAGIILAQTAQTVPDLTIRQHDFQPEREFHGYRRSAAPARRPRWSTDSPPIWQLPSAARDSGNNRPTSSAASCKACKTHPASTVMVLLSGSMARILFKRERLISTA